MKVWQLVLISSLVIVFSGCSLKPQVMDGDGMIRETEETSVQNQSG